MRKRFLLAVGLIIALVVPSVAFGVAFGELFPADPHHNGLIRVGVERVNGENNRVKRVNNLEFNVFTVNCPKSGPTHIETELDEAVTGNVVQNAVAIDVAVQHRKWHFNDLVLDAVGRSSNERIDATINFRGEFRKHDKNKADGTLEVTLEDVDFGSGPEDCHGGLVFHVRHLTPGQH